MSPEPETLDGELLEHRDRVVVGGDHPVLADDAFERDQLSLLALVRRIGGDMDVAAVVLEDGAVLRVGEAITSGAVEPECLRDTVRVLLGAAIDVDPEQLPAAQPLRTLREIVEALDLIAVEKNRFAHRSPTPDAGFIRTPRTTATWRL